MQSRCPRTAHGRAFTGVRIPAVWDTRGHRASIPSIALQASGVATPAEDAVAAKFDALFERMTARLSQGALTNRQSAGASGRSRVVQPHETAVPQLGAEPRGEAVVSDLLGQYSEMLVQLVAQKLKSGGFGIVRQPRSA